MKMVTKRVVSLLLTICMLASVIVAFPLTASAEETQVELTADGTYYEEYGLYFDKSTGTIIGYDDNLEGELIIPSEIDGVAVTSIGDWAFEWCTSLTSIKIPNGVTTIGRSAFRDCYKLASVTIPESVTTIERGAFVSEKLANIIVDEKNMNYSSVDGNLFNKDKDTLIQYAIGKNDKEYTIPDSVVSIGDSAFLYCGLTRIIIPSSVTSIGDYAFSQCKSLTSITIPDSITSIGVGIFDFCEITSITIPESVTRIEWMMFSECRSLTNITIPNSVTSIGEYAFAYCESLTDVYYIGTEAEWNSIEIGDLNDPLTNATIHYNYSIPFDPSYMPTDINEVTINGRGTAYGRFLIKNSDGSIAKNKSVYYTMNGGEKKITITDEYGYACICVSDITKSGDYSFTFSGKGIQTSNGVLSVTVKPLEFSSTYEAVITSGANVGVGIGVGGSIGDLKAEAKAAEIGVDGSVEKGISISQEYADNKNKLSITTKQNLKAALEAKVGLFANAKASSAAGVEASIGDIHGNASYGQTFGVGFEDEDFNPNDSGDVKNLAKFMLAAALESNGSNVVTRYLVDKINAPINSYEKGSAVALAAGASLGMVSVEAGGFEESLTVAGVDGGLVLSNSTSTKSDNSKSYKSSAKSDVGVKLFSSGAKVKEDKASAGSGISLYSDGANTGLSFGAEEDKNGELSKISVTTENSKNKNVGWTEIKKTEKHTIAYSDEAAKKTAHSCDALNRFANGEKGYFTPLQTSKSIDAMINSGQIGTYKTTVENTKGIDVDLSASVKLLVEIGGKIGISGVEGYEYELRNGIYDKAIYMQARNEIADEVEDEFLSTTEIVGIVTGEIADIIAEYWDTVSGWISDVGESIADAGSAVVKGIKDTGKKLKVSVSKLKESVGLMAVLAVDDEVSEFSTSSLAVTIGEPYVISVEDESGNVLTDLSDSPLLLSLSYTEEQLAAAGIGDVNDISILRWDDDKCVYVRMGGELDEANSCVNLEITKTGQYILAVDNCPPAITQFTASDNGISPKISAIVSDMSGISEFKFSIDDTEILDSQNFEEYYDFTTAKFEYPTEGLSDGEYTATIFAIDTFGNEIEQSISFTVNTTAPSIDNVSELGETVSDATEVTAEVSGEDVSYVFLNTEITDAFGNATVTSDEMNGENGVYSAKISDIPDGSAVSVWINAYNIYGNSSESEKQDAVVMPSSDGETTIAITKAVDGEVNVKCTDVDLASGAMVYLAVFDENGVLTQAQRKNVDDNVVFEGIEFKSKIKAFLWDDLTPLCESATLINTSEIQ